MPQSITEALARVQRREREARVIGEFVLAGGTVRRSEINDGFWVAIEGETGVDACESSAIAAVTVAIDAAHRQLRRAS